MLGGSGPSVTLQTPSASFFIASRPLAGIQSPVNVTSLALGARTRNVTRRSGCTSGETSVSGGGFCATAQGESNRTNRKCFMITLREDAPKSIAPQSCYFPAEPACRNACSHAWTSATCSGMLLWPVSSARSNFFRPGITLYAEYMEVGGHVSSLKPQE